jgi:hypothetical protein
MNFNLSLNIFYGSPEPKEFNMAKKMFFAGILCLTLVFGLLIAGCDIAGLLNNAANGGGTFDSALVGTWHLSQTAADDGQSAVFTFASDGRLTMSFSAEVYNASTSNGRISSTRNLSGIIVDSGSVDYRVANGTELTLTNPISDTGGDIFSSLMAHGGNGSFYKPAGSSGNGGNGNGNGGSGENGGNGDGKTGGSGENGGNGDGKTGGNGENGGTGSNGGEKEDDPAGGQGVPSGSSNPFLGMWWSGDGYSYIVIEDSTWEIPGEIKGTYTYTGTEARFTATHQWVGKGPEGEPGQPDAIGGDGTPAWSVNMGDEYWEKIEGGVYLFTAKVSGDRLIMTFEGSDTVLTRDSGGYPGSNGPSGNDTPADPVPVRPEDPVPEMPAENW